MDRPEAGGVVDELHQEVVLLRIAVVDQEPSKHPASGLEPVPRVPASDPSPPRDHLPPVGVAPEKFHDEAHSAAYLSGRSFVHGRFRLAARSGYPSAAKASGGGSSGIGYEPSGFMRLWKR